MTTINALTEHFFTATLRHHSQFGSLANHHSALAEALKTEFAARKHGRQAEWDAAFAELPVVLPSTYDLGHEGVSIGLESDLQTPAAALEKQLQQFTPWRKGPWRLFGVDVDTEWRSDWKWQRLRPHISSLKDRTVLDIGCGNGYHLFKMVDEGAALAVGIDPTRLFLYQFHVCKKYLPNLPVHLLPLRSEHLPAFNLFDTVFSLGVLYHRRSPIDHLTELGGFLRPGGELVLETLVVPGDETTLLVPKDRYAKMANVWFLPAVPMLETWLSRAGFVNVRTVDVNQTSRLEQRQTDWMTFQSLADFLDPNDPNKTYEGYPAPRRAITIAEKPG